MKILLFIAAADELFTKAVSEVFMKSLQGTLVLLQHLL